MAHRRLRSTTKSTNDSEIQNFIDEIQVSGGKKNDSITAPHSKGSKRGIDHSQCESVLTKRKVLSALNQNVDHPEHSPSPRLFHHNASPQSVNLFRHCSVRSPKVEAFKKRRPLSHVKQMSTLHRTMNSSSSQLIVGREQEMADILQFLKESEGVDRAGSMYISGPPGTGKSFSIQRVASQRDNVVYINCMSLPVNQPIFRVIATLLWPEQDSEQRYETSFLQSKLLTDVGRIRVVVVDEMDHVTLRNRKALRCLFQWACSSPSRLVLIGLANSLDMSLRLPPMTRHLRFAPYTALQLDAILRSRLSGTAVMTEAAVRLCSKKVAATSGDARNALDMCREALQRSQCSDSSSTITPLLMSEVMCKQNHLDIPLTQKLGLCALLLLTKNVKEVKMGKLYEYYVKTCGLQRLTAVDCSSFGEACTALEVSGFLTIHRNKEPRLARVRLRLLDEDEVARTVRDSSLFDAIMARGS